MSNMTYNIVKTHFFVYQALHYSQIYNFTFNHDYKFKTIIVLKDVRISKSKKYMYFYFLKILNTWIFFCGIYQSSQKN